MQGYVPQTPAPTLSPTQSPTGSPLPPSLEAPRPLERVGNNGSPPEAFPLGPCEGDCDSDDECQDGLYCYSRSFGTDGMPDSCTGSVSDFDFCFDRPAGYLWGMGNNGSPVDRYPLNSCEGDCDDDSECAAGLKCFQRVADEPVPGCHGKGSTGSDYCFDYTLSDQPTARPSQTPTAKVRCVSFNYLFTYSLCRILIDPHYFPSIVLYRSQQVVPPRLPLYHQRFHQPQLRLRMPPP